MRFTERLAEIGARPSIGTVADSYDNALAKTTNGLYKTECIYGPDTHGWDDVDEVELATLSWVQLVQRTTAAQPRGRTRGSADSGPANTATTAATPSYSEAWRSETASTPFHEPRATAADIHDRQVPIADLDLDPHLVAGMLRHPGTTPTLHPNDIGLW